MNTPNLSPQALDALLKMAGQKLGRDPQALKNQLQSGQLDQITQGMDSQQQQQIGALLSDRKALGHLLESPQVKLLLEQFMKGK